MQLFTNIPLTESINLYVEEGEHDNSIPYNRTTSQF